MQVRLAIIVGAVFFISICHSAPPKGCECIGKSKAQELIKKGSKKSLAEVGDDFGSYCAAWEDGACKAETCEHGPGHTCGQHKECTKLWPAYNFDLDQVPARPFTFTAT